MSTACGEGSVNIGGFFDNDLCKILAIDREDEIPLYAMAVGVPDGNSITARSPD